MTDTPNATLAAESSEAKEKFIMRRMVGLRQVTDGMLMEYPKACREGRLHLWENAIVALIKVYAHQEMPSLDRKPICEVHVKSDVMEMLTLSDRNTSCI